MASKDTPKLSIMERKFFSARGKDLVYTQPPASFKPTLYFFYGSLTKPDVLQRTLRLNQLPILRPAKIIGYSCRMWGQYPALVDEPGTVVEGFAYTVETEDHLNKLQLYETNHYSPHMCRILLENGESVVGATFKWHGDGEELEAGGKAHQSH